MMEKIVIVRNRSKESAVLVTRERLAAGHPEDLCTQDMQDWLYIVDKCSSAEEIQEAFELWAVRAELYEAKQNGSIH